MLKIGLIGCGFMGAMHANCYNNIEGVKVTAVADIRNEKAQEIAKISGADIYNEAYDLINNADVDIIDICLPTYLHSEVALAAMDKVKYVFVEKPVALTVEQGKAMIEKSKATGCQIQVGQVIRFWDEYVEHVVDKKCRAGACKSLMSYEIDAAKCIGCGACKRVCPQDAISGEKKMAHHIDNLKCIKCGACYEKCKFGAISIK